MNETIAAISTASGPGAISIVRVSGPEAASIARRLFAPAKPGAAMESHRLHYGRLIDPADDRTVDHILCVVMKAPYSYTKEDAAEFHCHGGPVVAAQALGLCLAAGARLAEPGEFTRRAFLAGRIDLTQAEAVVDLINARSRAEANLAARQLSGGLSGVIQSVVAAVVGLLARLEVALDFPDEDVDIYHGPDEAGLLLAEAAGPLDELLANYDQGRFYREGAKVALVGRPNVGKSSLLNALLAQERAIVTEIPGTTRDVIEADAVINGAPMILLDTAGISLSPQDPVEAEGQSRAVQRLAEADLALLVLDASSPWADGDGAIFRQCPTGRTIVVFNKVDLVDLASVKEAASGLGDTPFVPTSARFGDGLPALRTALARRLTPHADPEYMASAAAPVTPRERHRRSIVDAREALSRAASSLAADAPADIIAADLRDALDHLGAITGPTTPDDVLDEVFSRFCLGK